MAFLLVEFGAQAVEVLGGGGGFVGFAGGAFADALVVVEPVEGVLVRLVYRSGLTAWGFTSCHVASANAQCT